MNMRIGFVTVNLLFASAAFSSCYAVNKQASQNDFIPPGKWSVVTPGESSKPDDVDGSYYCVPKGNRAPDPKRLAAEVAASSSTGDYRWIGECSILKYGKQEHAFSARLSCSQASERTGIKHRFLVDISGELLDKTTYKITTHVPDAMSGPYSEIDTYRLISNICNLNQKRTIIGPKTSIAQPINPLLSDLAGLPEGTETNEP